MSLKSWKHVERKHSQLLRCSGRTGPTGRDLPDSYSNHLAVESKCTARPPRLVQEALDQAIENTARLAEMEAAKGLTPPQRLPVVVIHEDRTAHDYDLVVLRLDDFLQRVLPALERETGTDGKETLA